MRRNYAVFSRGAVVFTLMVIGVFLFANQAAAIYDDFTQDSVLNTSLWTRGSNATNIYAFNNGLNISGSNGQGGGMSSTYASNSFTAIISFDQVSMTIGSSNTLPAFSFGMGASGSADWIRWYVQGGTFDNGSNPPISPYVGVTRQSGAKGNQVDGALFPQYAIGSQGARARIDYSNETANLYYSPSLTGNVWDHLYTFNNFTPSQDNLTFGMDTSPDGSASFTALSVDISSYEGGSTAPIPSAVWLFGSGLAGLIGIKKKYLG